MSDDRYLFATTELPAVPVIGGGLYPVRRIFCVGRNYVDHAKEMNAEVDREAPFYFLKNPLSLVASGATIAYPPGSENVHYEMEFVVAIGRPAFRVSVAEAPDVVFGYAGGFDMTRRDLQFAARDKGRPWDLAKDFEQSAVISPITPADSFTIADQAITLDLNGETKQSARLDMMVWDVPSLISHLSRYYHLGAGDLVYTGTPAGVGAVRPGDHLSGAVEGLGQVELTIAEGE